MKRRPFFLVWFLFCSVCGRLQNFWKNNIDPWSDLALSIIFLVYLIAIVYTVLKKKHWKTFLKLRQKHIFYLFFFFEVFPLMSWACASDIVLISSYSFTKFFLVCPLYYVVHFFQTASPVNNTCAAQMLCTDFCEDIKPLENRWSKNCLLCLQICYVCCPLFFYCAWFCNITCLICFAFQC